MKSVHLGCMSNGSMDFEYHKQVKDMICLMLLFVLFLFCLSFFFFLLVACRLFPHSGFQNASNITIIRILR